MNTSDKLKKFITLALLLAAVLLPRIVLFSSVPGGINQDGAMAAINANALAHHGTDLYGTFMPVHLEAWGFGQMSSLLSYLMVPFIRIFGMNSFSIRLPQLIASLMGLAFLWLFAKDAFEKQPALYILFFAAVSPWHIMQSRWALDCNLFPHFLMGGMYFLYRGISGKKKRSCLFISMLFFGLCMYCYGVAIYTVPLLLAMCCLYLLIRKEIKISDSLLCALIFLLVSWPFIVCMAINAFSLPTISTPFFTIQHFSASQRSADILFFSAAPMKQLWQNAVSTAKILFQFYDGLPWNNMPVYATLYVFSIPLIILGAVKTISSMRKSTPCALVSFFFFTAIFCGLITANVNVNRINILFYPLILFGGTGLNLLCRRMRSMRYVLPAVYLAALCLFCRAYFIDFSDDISRLFMEDFGEAVTAVKDFDANHIYITADSQYKGYSHVSRVLTLYYHNIDSEYFRSPEFDEKYRFSTPSVPDASGDSVYVVRDYELPLFDPDLFSFKPFGRFYTVYAK